MTADVLIVGGGIIGQSAALALSARGLTVTLVERGPLGGQASSAAAGILAPEIEAVGEGPLLDLALRSRERWPAFASQIESASGIEIDFRNGGALRVAFDESESAELDRIESWQRARGLSVERLDDSGLAALEPSLRPARSALRYPEGRQIDPRRLMRALAVATSRAPITVMAREVIGIRHDRKRVLGVDTDSGTIFAGQVLIAAGCWSSRLEGASASRSVRPLRGQLIELQLPQDVLQHTVFACGGYLVPRTDGRVVAGSTEEEVGFDASTTDAAVSLLAARAARIAPALAIAPILRSWAGLRPTTENHFPILGAGILAGLYWATGHHRNGILLAPATTDAVVSWICEKTATPLAWSAFSPNG